MKLRTALQAAVFILASSVALAGSSTVTVLDSTGTTKTFNVTTDGSGHFVSQYVLCDQSAAANCATVDSNHNMAVGQATAANLNATVVGTGTFATQSTVSQGTAASLNATVVGTGTFATQSTVSQGTAANLNATVVGTGTFATQATQSGTWNVTNVSGTVSLPTGAAISAAQNTNGQTTAHTCSTGGFSELGCLGQIDDDLKAAIPAGTNVVGYTSNDPCAQAAKTNVPISTASGTLALVTGVSAKKVYVCSLVLIAAGAISVSLSEGSGATCGTSAQAGVIGVATNGTAANGMAFAANGGITLGNGSGTVAVTATAANYLCLFQSGTTQIAGNLTYVQQ